MAAGDGILRFDFTEAENTIETMSRANNDLVNELNNIDAVVKGKLQYWTGTARDYYNANHQKWRQKAETLTTDLGKAQAALAQIRQEWELAESRNVQRFAN